MNMFHLSAVRFLFVLVSLEGISGHVSVQLAGNNSGLETVEGKSGFTVIVCVCVCVCVTMCNETCHHPVLHPVTVSSGFTVFTATTTALILCIHCFLAHLLSMKGNFNVHMLNHAD